MFFVYVLKDTESGKLYVGSCENLGRRLSEHERLKPTYRIVYKEERTTKADAQRRERYLKTGNGRRALKSLLRV